MMYAVMATPIAKSKITMNDFTAFRPCRQSARKLRLSVFAVKMKINLKTEEASGIKLFMSSSFSNLSSSAFCTHDVNFCICYNKLENPG